MTTSPTLRRIGLAATLVLALTACSANGSSTASSAIVTVTVAPGTPLDPLHQQVYDITRSSALAQGVQIDQGCLTNIVAQFSDADAQLIVVATPKADTPTLSAAGTGLVHAVPGCVVPAASTTTTIR